MAASEVLQFTAIWESESPGWVVYGLVQPPVSGTEALL